MPVRITRGTQITLVTSTVLAGAAWLAITASVVPAAAEAGQSTEAAPPQVEAPAAEAPAAEAPAKETEHGGHGGMMGGGMHGGMQMQGGTQEGGMSGCKMMQGGTHEGGTHDGGMQGCKMMQGGMHEGGKHDGGMQGGDHAGMKHDGKDAAQEKTAEAKAAEMRKMMHEMMSTMAARADARLAALKTELAITDAQLPQWTAFADAVRAAARAMEQAHKDKMAAEAAARMPEPKPAPAPEPTPGGTRVYPGMEAIKKLDVPAPAPQLPPGSLLAKVHAHEQMMTRHLDGLRAIEVALAPLYATFDDKQKAIADGLKIGPMGVM